MTVNVFVGDLHLGSLYGLWPPEALLDEGGKIELNVFQQTLWDWWVYFWDEWIPKEIGKEKYILWIPGDLTEGDFRSKV